MATSQKQKVDVEAIVNAILDGEADDEFDQIYGAIKTRTATLTHKKAATFKKGDKVRFNGSARPVYIQGVTGVIEQLVGSKAMVRLDTTAGRFGSDAPIRTPFSIIEKV